MAFSPTTYGFGVPRGQGRPILLLPGHRANDLSMQPMWWALNLKGERPYFSELGSNVTCFEEQVSHCERRVDYIRSLRAHRDRKVNIIGWSQGGLLGGALKRLFPEKIGKLITLGTPQQLTSAVHPLVAWSTNRAGEAVRRETGRPKCWTADCNCGFVETLKEGINPDRCIYSPFDGIADGEGTKHATDPTRNRRVTSSHIGMGFDPQVYRQAALALEGA